MSTDQGAPAGRRQTCGYKWNTEHLDPDSRLTDHECLLPAGHDDDEHKCTCGMTAEVRAVPDDASGADRG